MPEQCWHNRDIFLPKFAIVANFINFLPNYPTKFIDHKAVIIYCICAIWIENTTLLKSTTFIEIMCKSHYLSSKF